MRGKKNCHYIIGLLLLLCPLVSAQENINAIHNKPFNFGGTVGFTSHLPVINSITFNDYKMENIRSQYKVGYLASVFGRVNFNNFFIQPSLSWVHAESEIHFMIPESITTDNAKGEGSEYQTNAQIDVTSRSLEIPVLIGYNFIRDGAYALSVVVGPKFKYNYDINYTSLSEDSIHEFVSENTPYGISIAVGVGVSIWRLFLDFQYEFGINEVESDFIDKNESLPLPRNSLTIDKRVNVLSFSLGFLF